jgi:parallel beta-helix repeat protein
MKNFFVAFIVLLFNWTSYAQQEFHVFPLDHESTPGSSTGNGSLQNPWDLQTALNQDAQAVNGGDIIWLHDGVYNGRFKSTLQSTINDKFITVASFSNEWAILNGNIKSNRKAVLTITGANVIFKDFEVTWLGNFPRIQTETNFQKSDGVSHTNGVNCKFVNLVIHNNPGSGFGSWKRTGNSIIDGCIIFNNGYYSSKRASGVGIYVQNSSEKFRLIKNNIIFNNYYKGVEVWSDNRKAKEAYVKNIVLENNVIFNSAIITGKPKDNLIIATNDNNAVNIAKNITVKNNILYHNTNYTKNQIDGQSPSLTLGFNKNAPIEDITLTGNIILGRNDGIRILHAKNFTFKNNTVYSGFIRFYKSFYDNFNQNIWHFSDNKYYTRKDMAFRIQSKEDFTLGEWQKKHQIDENSTWKHISEFNMNHVLDVTQNEYNKNKFRIVLFNKNENDVTVDFSNYNLPQGISYTIIDIEDHKKILKSGVLNDNKKIVFPMKLNGSNKNKSLDNFGVYTIEFNEAKITKKTSFVSRLFKWLF